jgi:hypothetical protein
VPDDALERLRRWEDAGGHWRIVSERAGSLVVALERCDGGEEVDRVVSHDPAFIDYATSHSDGWSGG